MSTPSLRDLAWLVARDVNRTVGGGVAAMELMRRTFESRGWLPPPAHALAVAVSRLTPGTNLLAYCVAVGWRLAGAAGALVALLAASAPSAAVIAVLMATLVRVDESRVFQALLAVATLAASVLVFSSAWFLLLPHLSRGRRARAAMIVVVAAGLYSVGLTPVRVLLVSALCGAAIARQRP